MIYRLGAGAMLLLLVGGCGPKLPPLSAAHPASPDAPEAPAPPASDTLKPDAAVRFDSGIPRPSPHAAHGAAIR